ncbi:J domain-containing protein [Vibrio sinaloensis]|uniref:J domain-containing protein n=1 Tax=Photobacterium sp. (strain ATCC 43367) TaxID=379097 RepID=UPI0035EB8336
MKFVALLLLLLSPFSLANTIEVLTERAQNQDVDAQITLAQSYLTGTDVTPSRQEAIYWFELAADSGSQIAAGELAQLYLDDSNGQRDTEKAVYWLTKLAVDDNPQAQLTLGQVYESLGSKLDNLDMAEVWYRVASDQLSEAEDAYGRVLEKKFNAQRAKQVSSIDQLEVAFDDSSIELSPIAKSKSSQQQAGNDFIYLSIALSVALAALIAWHLKTTRKLTIQTHRTSDDNKSERKKLNAQIKQQEATIKQQKRQLETLYRQFKKQQNQRSETPKAKAAPQDQKLALACALFGYKPGAIPDNKQIKVRYKQLCKIYHPDLNGNEEDMKRLNAALKVILANVNN